MNIQTDYHNCLLRSDKILYLTLKKKWFDMIAIGEKRIEYREIKFYWYSRLAHFNVKKQQIEFKHFDKIVFKNGYGDIVPTLIARCQDIAIEQGVLNWGSKPSQSYFAIHIGKIIYNGSEYVL